MQVKSILFILISIVFSPCFAQTQRIEIEIKRVNAQLKVIPLAKEGLILAYENTNNNERARTQRWTISKFDTDFNEIWSFETSLQNGLSVSHFQTDSNFLYLLFVKSREFLLLKASLKTGESESFKGRINHADYQINNFLIIDNQLFMVGNSSPDDSKMFFRSMLSYIFFPLAFIPNFIPGRQALMLHHNIETRVTREISFNSKGNSNIISITNDTTAQKITVITESISGKNATLSMQNFKYNGLRIKSVPVKTFTSNYQLLSGNTSIISSKEKFITGTFAKEKLLGAQGIYFSQYNENEQNFIQYHSFTNMKNFFSYLDEQTKERVKRKIERKKKNGKDLQLEYQLLMHQPIFDSSGIYMVGEAYYPKYHTEFRTIWVYGRPMEQSYEVFDGWNFTHAFVVALNKKGKMLWDNFMPIDNILSYDLSEKLKAFNWDKNIVFIYNNHGIVQYKKMNSDSVSSIKFANQTSDESGDLNRVDKYEVNSAVCYWYEKNIISYGTWVIENDLDKYVKNKKIVLYISKNELE